VVLFWKKSIPAAMADIFSKVLAAGGVIAFPKCVFGASFR
jgi:hypothetical protein